MSEGSNEIKKPWGLGLVWIAGWLFSIGFLGLGLRDGFFGLAIWPYQLGAAMSGF
ncbi:MAG: hypothetical protein L3J21_09620 [Devosiaceae bacterium]|nr:hypothetical protein [Devosiaceae bacterium]